MADPYDVGLARTPAKTISARPTGKRPKRIPIPSGWKPSSASRRSTRRMSSWRCRQAQAHDARIDETGAERQPSVIYREYAEPSPTIARAPRRGWRWRISTTTSSPIFRAAAGAAQFPHATQDVRYALEVDFLDAGGARPCRCRTERRRHPIRRGSATGAASQRTGLPGPTANRRRLCRDLDPATSPRSNGREGYSEHADFARQKRSTGPVCADTVDGRSTSRCRKASRKEPLRLRGKGVASGKDGGRGDQFVTIHIAHRGRDDALAQFMAEWRSHLQNPVERARRDMIRQCELFQQFTYLEQHVLPTWIEWRDRPAPR